MSQMFYDLARQGKLWFASNQAAVTLSALSTTATGLILCNPFGSGKNIALMKVTWFYSTAPAGAAPMGIAMSPAPSQTAVTHTTPINQIQNAILDGNAKGSVAKVDSVATTVGTPIWALPMGGPVAASQITPPFLNLDVEGAIILPPGTSLQLAYLTTAAVGMGSMWWTEY